MNSHPMRLLFLLVFAMGIAVAAVLFGSYGSPASGNEVKLVIEPLVVPEEF